MPWMTMPSKNTELKQTFARGSANTLRNPAATALRLKGFDRAGLRPRKAKKAITATIAPKPPIDKNTPRQPSRSPMAPASTAPIRFPVNPTAKRRPIATWRECTGTRSPTIATPTGKMPPAHMPAMMRMVTSSVKLLAKAQINVVVTTAARLIFISRVLPKKSPTVPSAGCMMA